MKNKKITGIVLYTLQVKLLLYKLSSQKKSLSEVKAWFKLFVIFFCNSKFCKISSNIVLSNIGSYRF